MPRKGIVLFRISLLVAAVSLLTGLTWVSGKITWQYLSPLSWPSTFDTKGIPLPQYIFKEPAYNSPQFLKFITATLPEGRDQSATSSLFQSTVTRNIYLRESDLPTVQLAFVYEGSNYKNSLGYFLFDPDDPPTSKTDNARIIAERIIFPNASLFNSGGSSYGLRNGDSIMLDLSHPGKTTKSGVLGVGFFLVTEGFSATEGVRSTALANWIFHSLPVMNSETSPLNEHTVLLKDPASSKIALAIEETNRTSGMGSDHDFNDVVYSVIVTPETAIVNTDAKYGEKIVVMSVDDRDGDGVLDSLDEFPDDKDRAFSSWYPSQTGLGMLVYEDQWPKTDDYDMNDLVMNYRIQQISNANGLIKEIRMTYQIMAKGAGRSNGFAVELSGLNSTITQTATINGIPLMQSGAANGFLAFKFFNDSNVEAPNPTGYDYFNTVKSQQPAATGKIYQLNIVFTTPFDKLLLKYAAPYNPYIFHKEATGEEIHLPGLQPTAAADISKFGTQDDNTNLSEKRYYVSKLGYPWAFNLPQGWKWPTERTDIVTAYPDFKTWAESGGSLKPGWYLAPSSNTGYTY